MTREEAIAFFKDMNECTYGNLEAVERAIKALEPILDKIRAEIEQLDYLTIKDGSDGYDYYVDKYDVLKIIDKHMAESEG